MALSDRKKVLLAELALLLCGLIWGTGFAVMKNTLDYLAPNWLLGIRFVFASALFFIAIHRRVLKAKKHTLLGGAIAGIVIYAAFISQTIGLTTTTAGNNAFLTAIYVVLVPFINWAVKKIKPGRHAILAAALCFAGVGIIAINGGFRIYPGDAWTLLGGALFAVHIVIVAHYSDKGADVLALTCVQFLFTGLCALLAAIPFEPMPSLAVLMSSDTLLSVGYLVIMCTVLAMGAQNIGLRYAPAAHASLLMGTEAPFGFLAGIIWLGEPFTLRFILGAVLIAGSIVYSELGGAKRQTLIED